MNRSFAVICFTVALDAIGIGLVMPVLPSLLKSLGHSGGEVAGHYGVLLSAYAVMQFLCSPLLGALSDRFGRRPVLLASLAGGTIDYLIMAATPYLWLLYATRIVAGVTGANMAIASAVIADSSDAAARGKRFGQMSAAFGIGFLLGPVLGGWLGEIHLRGPFIGAAILCATNFLMVLFALPESSPVAIRKEVPPPFRWPIGGPFTALASALRKRALRRLLIVYGLLAVIGQSGASLWVIYGQERYHWSPLVVGVSLASFGLFHAAAQAFLPGPLIHRLGERFAAVVAMIVDAFANAYVGLMRNGWWVLAGTPIFCIGGVATPALQAMLSQAVSEEEQGQLQGNLASLMSLAGAISPVLCTQIYILTRGAHPGLVWILIGSLYFVCIPLMFGRPKPTIGNAV